MRQILITQMKLLKKIIYKSKEFISNKFFNNSSFIENLLIEELRTKLNTLISEKTTLTNEWASWQKQIANLILFSDPRDFLNWYPIKYTMFNHPLKIELGELVKSEYWNIFKIAIQENVAFVLGTVFHCDGSGKNTLRINFSYMSKEMNEEGARRLANAIRKMMR